MAKKDGSSRSWFTGTDLFVGTLILCFLITGLLIVNQSRERLQTYTLLTELRLQQDRELSEYSRLLLEKESLSAYAIVLERAESRGFQHPSDLHINAVDEGHGDR